MYSKVLLARCCKMSAPITCLWALLSLMVAVTCTFSYFQPFWFLHPDYTHSFGMYNFCVQDLRYGRPRPRCRIYGGYLQLGNLPSGPWQVSSLLYGGGCAFSVIGAALALLTLCVPPSLEQRISTLSGYIQTAAVLIMTAGLIIYPMGLGSPFFRYYCGNSNPYNSGHCRMGWSYMLGIMGTALSVFCPFLSRYTDIKTSDIGDSIFV